MEVGSCRGNGYLGDAWSLDDPFLCLCSTEGIEEFVAHRVVPDGACARCICMGRRLPKAYYTYLHCRMPRSACRALLPIH